MVNPPITNYQTIDTPRANRTDHIWFKLAGGWKCMLCGAVIIPDFKRTQVGEVMTTTVADPPPYPTPPDWTPVHYDKLTDNERMLKPKPY